MKKCPYCGKEYPDEVERCLIDDELLPGGEPQSEVIPRPSPAPVTGRFTERQWTIFEIVLVCAVAFGSSLITSIYYLLFPPDLAILGASSAPVTGSFVNSSGQIYTWLLRCFHEIAPLGLLGYVLTRNGRSFRDLGLTWTRKDLGWSIILISLALLGSGAFYKALYYAGFTVVDRHTAYLHTGLMLFGGGISFTTVLFQIINPFFEELIARAYVMTEVKRLTGSATKAIVVSTVLQTSYHFYQGVPSALALGVTFLFFSIFYARTNRIVPVILAHLFIDLSGTVWFMLHR